MVTSAPSRRDILWAIKRTVREEYGEDRAGDAPISEESHIYADLRLDEPLGKSDALDCMYTVARELGIPERKVAAGLAVRIGSTEPRPDPSHDYTIGEIADAFERALQ